VQSASYILRATNEDFVASIRMKTRNTYRWRTNLVLERPTAETLGGNGGNLDSRSRGTTESVNLEVDSFWGASRIWEAPRRLFMTRAWAWRSSLQYKT
jgi:hypothetical protein